MPEYVWQENSDGDKPSTNHEPKPIPTIRLLLTEEEEGEEIKKHKDKEGEGTKASWGLNLTEVECNGHSDCCNTQSYPPRTSN